MTPSTRQSSPQHQPIHKRVKDLSLCFPSPSLPLSVVAALLSDGTFRPLVPRALAERNAFVDDGVSDVTAVTDATAKGGVTVSAAVKVVAPLVADLPWAMEVLTSIDNSEQQSVDDATAGAADAAADFLPVFLATVTAAESEVRALDVWRRMTATCTAPATCANDSTAAVVEQDVPFVSVTDEWHSVTDALVSAGCQVCIQMTDSSQAATASLMSSLSSNGQHDSVALLVSAPSTVTCSHVRDAVSHAVCHDFVTPTAWDTNVTTVLPSLIPKQQSSPSSSSSSSSAAAAARVQFGHCSAQEGVRIVSLKQHKGKTLASASASSSSNSGS